MRARDYTAGARRQRGVHCHEKGMRSRPFCPQLQGDDANSIGDRCAPRRQCMLRDGGLPCTRCQQLFPLLVPGNFINGGTSRGRAWGFKLSLLGSLDKVRSTSSSLTLLRCVCLSDCVNDGRCACGAGSRCYPYLPLLQLCVVAWFARQTTGPRHREPGEGVLGSVPRRLVVQPGRV